MVELPSELWLCVFDTLFHIPSALELRDHRTIEAYSEDANGIVFHNILSQLARRKLAISVVSRNWRRLALPFLYREILIRSGRHASMLAATLQTHKKCHGSIQGQQPPGCWIRRIEVFTEVKYWDEECHQALTVILENAPNLVAFSDAFCTVPSNLVSFGPLVKQLGSLCSLGSLRRLEWYCDTPTTLSLVLGEMPLLEVLVLCRGHVISDHTNTITLPRLHTLSIGPYVGLSKFTYMNAPILQNVLLFRSIITSDCSGFYQWLLSRGSLLHLRMPSTDVLAEYMNVEDFTCLTSMTIDFGQWRKFTRPITGDFSHKLLERVNLHNFGFTNSSLYWNNYHKDYHWSTTFSFMHSLLDKQSLPSLKTIGFYIPHSYQRANEFGELVASLDIFWGPWLEACRKRGIGVEVCLNAEDHLGGVWEKLEFE